MKAESSNDKYYKHQRVFPFSESQQKWDHKKMAHEKWGPEHTAQAFPAIYR